MHEIALVFLVAFFLLLLLGYGDSLWKEHKWAKNSQERNQPPMTYKDFVEVTPQDEKVIDKVLKEGEDTSA